MLDITQMEERPGDKELILCVEGRAAIRIDIDDVCQSEYDQRKEIAKLISAAPDLLEACTGHGLNLLALLDRLTEGHIITNVESELLMDQTEYIRAAIAKAQGESK